MSNTQAGKGDKPRPVNKEKYNSNYDSINWHKELLDSSVDQKKTKTKKDGS